MKVRSSPFPFRAAWLPKPPASGAYRHWLVDDGSLTQRLRKHCRTFSVERVRQRWARPLPDEVLLLRMRSHEKALLREVSLCCDGVQVVFAHSVLPRSSLRGAWHNLGRLGAKPLGAVLFANPEVIRTPLAFRKLLPHHALYTRAVEHLAERPACLWARRSVFMLHNAPILVTEVFLPGVLE
ncbi:MAG TPA: chorismate lyase [Methylophilaceae bacterium]|jgi:chorismate--pyruvate lyase|nr:chorismate lyase [Methylophilaceae bacterium]